MSKFSLNTSYVKLRKSTCKYTKTLDFIISHNFYRWSIKVEISIATLVTMFTLLSSFCLIYFEHTECGIQAFIEFMKIMILCGSTTCFLMTFYENPHRSLIQNLFPDFSQIAITCFLLTTSWIEMSVTQTVWTT